MLADRLLSPVGSREGFATGLGGGAPMHWLKVDQVGKKALGSQYAYSFSPPACVCFPGL